MTEYLSSFDYQLIADALDVLDPDGSEATRRKQELEAWARQMAVTGRGHLPAINASSTELETIGAAVDYGRTFVDDWNDDEGLDDESRADAEAAERTVERAEELLQRLAGSAGLANAADEILALGLDDDGDVIIGADEEGRNELLDQLRTARGLPALGSWRDQAAALRSEAARLCEAEPGHGTPAYRGDPMRAVSLQQQADRFALRSRDA